MIEERNRRAEREAEMTTSDWADAMELTDRERLKALETRVTMAVCHVEGTVTKAENDELARLRAIVGETFDAINGTWRPFSEEA